MKKPCDALGISILISMALRASFTYRVSIRTSSSPAFVSLRCSHRDKGPTLGSETLRSGDSFFLRRAVGSHLPDGQYRGSRAGGTRKPQARYGLLRKERRADHRHSRIVPNPAVKLLNLAFAGLGVYFHSRDNCRSAATAVPAEGLADNDAIQLDADR